MLKVKWFQPVLKKITPKSRRLEYERVYLPLCEVADTPFHIQGDEVRAYNQYI